VFARSIDLAVVECRKVIGRSADPLTRLELIVRYIVMGGSTDDPSAPDLRRGGALCREQMRLADVQPEKLRCALGPLIGLFAEQLSAGMEANIVRRDDAEDLASLVYNLASITVHAVTLAQEDGRSARSERRRLADSIWEFCRCAIVA
jgi:hypothetical protein